MLEIFCKVPSPASPPFPTDGRREYLLASPRCPRAVPGVVTADVYADTGMSAPSTIDASLRQLVREIALDVVREVVRTEVVPLLDRHVAAASAQEAGAALPSLIALKDAAAILGVKERTLRRWIHDRRLRALSVGRLIRIERTELERFLIGATLSGRAPCWWRPRRTRAR